jgi:surfeit locus 1 family protein
LPTARHEADRDTPRAVTFTLAGIAGTIVLGAVIILFLRLGFWQLDRRAERAAINTAVAARLDQAPIADIDLLGDTAGLTYRVALASGTFDNERYIVLPGRSHRGVPGVYLLMPLRLTGRTDAILVNRGWVPSPDAATIDVTDFIVHDPVDVRGLVLPFPGRAQSLSERATSDTRAGEFRHVWFGIDERALRAQFPYVLIDATLQEIGPSAEAGYPVKLDPPPLDAGPHLGYAIQWFAFALIGVIGWFALVLRARATRTAAAIVMGAALCAAPEAAHAQLRPLDPLEWRIFDGDAAFIAGAGAGVLWDQPAPLAGTQGTLLEAGTYIVALRSGRIAIELGGTALWRLTENDVIGTPSPEVEPSDGTRQEPGGAYASTAFRFSPDAWPADLVLRFGASIPTTSDQSGLDRDRTDFFALLSARYRTGPLTLRAENGVGINGTLLHDLPQSDVWTFVFGATYALRPVTLHADLVGRQDGHTYVIRGNEDQRELRAGLDIGRSPWLRLQYVYGLSDFSPAQGVRVSAGILLDGRAR